MNIASWVRKRGPVFIFQRGKSLLNRYGLGPEKAMKRIDSVMAIFSSFSCSPTFPVPGRIVERHSKFIHSLQERGAEISVHGYNHVDLKAMSPEKGSQQLQRATLVFKRHGLETHGFRAPYLSSSDSLLKAIPDNIFRYSSNKSVRWKVFSHDNGDQHINLFNKIEKFYTPEEAHSIRCLPFFQSNLVEIPVSVPDDLQLKDGLGCTSGDLSGIWVDLLQRTYEHGEIFNLMFHPELASFCEKPFFDLLTATKSYTPGVWVARLGDIAEWWWKKSTLRISISKDGGKNIKIELPDVSQSTWLARGLDLPDSTRWDSRYNRLNSEQYQMPDRPIPFIGIDKSVPVDLIMKLSNQGYILDLTETAASCSLYLDGDMLKNYPDEAAIVDAIENSPKPLIRLWPWPKGYRSALCITGDLDALSLMDYIDRLFSR